MAALLAAAALCAVQGCRGDPAEPAPEPAAPAPVAPAPDDSSFTMIALGDSYTVGENVPAHLCWPHQLADSLAADGVEVSLTMVAETGWTTAELLPAAAAADTGRVYDTVTVMIGVNDQFQGHGADHFAARLDSILAVAVSLAGGRPGHVAVFSIPDYGVTPHGLTLGGARVSAEIDRFNAEARPVSRAHGSTWIDVTTASRAAADEPGLVARDGIHFSGSMYARWVELMTPVLVPMMMDADAGTSR
jgi:lysophospholipase L1-like esterase